MIEENRAKVVEAEAEVPKAIAQAFRDGNAGHHGLLQAPERPGRYRHADLDRQDHRGPGPRREPRHDPPELTALLADVGDVFGVVVVIVVIVVAVVGRLVSWLQAISAEEAQKARQRPQNAPRRTPLDDEIGEFLRKAAQRRAGGPPAARPAQPASRQPPRARREEPWRSSRSKSRHSGSSRWSRDWRPRPRRTPLWRAISARSSITDSDSSPPPASRRPRWLLRPPSAGNNRWPTPWPWSQRTGGPAGQRRGDAPGDRAQRNHPASAGPLDGSRVLAPIAANDASRGRRRTSCCRVELERQSLPPS